jgi:hypothetical protein
MITFSCPGCSRQFSLKEEFAGKRTKCPTCKSVLVVPTEQGLGLGSSQAPPSEQVAVPLAPTPQPAGSGDFSQGPQPTTSKRSFLKGLLFGGCGCFPAGVGATLAFIYLVVPGLGLNKVAIPIPSLGPNKQETITAFLKKNLNDPSGLEFLEWYDSVEYQHPAVESVPLTFIMKFGVDQTPVFAMNGDEVDELMKSPRKFDKVFQGESASFVRVRFRAKLDAITGLTLHDWTFVFREGKIIVIYGVPQGNRL